MVTGWSEIRKDTGVVCEYCGNEITSENNGGFSITISCSDWHNSYETDFIRGEYSTKHFVKMGDMCENCARLLLHRIEDAIADAGLPERYEDIDKDLLRKIIKEERDKANG